MRTATLFGLPKVVALVAVAMALGGGAYAFTASNTVSSSPAGQGESSSMSGYTATSVVWTPDSNASDIQKVAFTLSTVTAGTLVYAGADNGSTIDWSNTCSQGTITSGSATETCTFSTEPAASTLTKLAVSAAN